MSLKQILASTFLLTSSLLVQAGSGYGDGGSSGSGSGSGYGSGSSSSSAYGPGSSSSYGSGSGSGYGSGSGSGSGSGGGGYGNQGDQSSYNGDGYGGSGRGGGGSSTSYGWGQSTALVETISVTETMMMTTTITESVCSTNAVATWSASWSGPPPMNSPPGIVSVQVVHVSDNSGTLAYSPNSVVAEIGSIVEFIFYPKNHTVTQSSFAVPCVPIGISTPNATTPESPGIKSGFVPVAANASDFMSGIRSSFSVMVNDTKPIWIYCGQVGHCEKGMSMVINQNMSDSVHTLANYQAAAAMIPVPGENSTTSPPPPGGAPPYGGAPGASTSTSTFTAAAFPPPNAPTSPPVVTQQPPAVTTSAVAAQSATTSAPSVGTFTGAAVALTVKKMGAAAGVLAMGVAALL